MVGGQARTVVNGLRLVADDVGWTHGDGPGAATLYARR